MNIIESGNVETPVGTLQCSLYAAIEITKKFGGFVPIARYIAELDANVINTIVAVGLTTDEKKPVSVEEVAEKVFAVGHAVLAEKCGEYLVRLGNGGRLPVDVASAGTSAVSAVAG